MKKILSVFLAILIMVTSCVCALTVFAVEPCVDHEVTTWINNNKKNHVGECTKCGKQVKKAHNLVAGTVFAPTCTVDGYTHYTCVCGYAESRDVVKSSGHFIKSATYDYDENDDGIFNELDINYTKSYECANNCGMASTKGTTGNSNYCPLCEKYTLIGKKEVYATCTTTDYVTYYCSNSECDSEFFIEGKEILDHKYKSEVVESTCAYEGYTLHTCVMCGDSYRDNFIPKKQHKPNRAGTEATYTYSDGKCTIVGYCSACDEAGTVKVVKEYATAEKCTGGCESGLISKTVTFPANCEEEIKIKTNCNAACPTQEITALPVGHSAETVTYEYHDNGTLKSVKVDCYNCGKGKDTKGDEYNTASTCLICSSIIEKRVVFAPTCDANGYTRVTCPECGEYTESTKNKLTHGGNEAEWIFNRESGTYTFRSNCTKGDCGGYTFTSAIGTAGKCLRCGRDSLTYKKVVYSECMSNGYTNADCAYCGSYEGYDIKTSLPHDYVSTNSAADCENGGATKNTCKNCYYTVETNKTEALGHIGGVEEIKYNGSTKTTSGWCERCNNYYTKTEAYEAYEDDCANGHTNGITSRIVVKPDCGKGDSGYTRVYCKNCPKGYYDTNIVAAQHKYGSWTIVLEPTCVESGIRTRKCELCKSTEEDIIPANQTATGDPKHKYVIMVKGIPATCTEPGTSDEMYCSSCGDYKRSVPTEPLGHIFEPGSKNKDFCDRCDSYVIGEGAGAVSCGCMCHNRDGLAKFFFKIILFFCQILNINQNCECGTIHY